MYKVRLDGAYLYHPWDKERTLSSGVLTQELNKNGSFDCTIPIENPLFQRILRRKSMIEVVRFTNSSEEVIYRGCCMNDTDGNDFVKELQTDGDLVFLNDTSLRPYNRTTTPQEEFKQIIQTHNSLADPSKNFVVGKVTITGEAERRHSESYKATKTAIDELQETYGGYIRTRAVHTVNYIDWLAAYDERADQEIRYGENIIDISKYIKVEDIATRVIPLGKSGTTIKSINDGRDYVEDETAIQQFGLIEKIVEFSDIESPLKLKEAGVDYLNTSKGAALTVELMAVDLANIGIEVQALRLGDQVHCTAKAYGIDSEMQITKLSIDILKPSSSKVTLGSTIQTFTQNQMQNVSGIIPKVSRAVSIAGDAYQSAAKAGEGVEQIKEEIDNIRDGIVSIESITNIEIENMLK